MAGGCSWRFGCVGAARTAGRRWLSYDRTGPAQLPGNCHNAGRTSWYNGGVLPTRTPGDARVSKKKPHGRPPSVDLKTRARRAADQGRFQSALDLARQLHKEQPTPEHLAFLRNCYLGRARQQRQTGQMRDAANTLQAGLAVAGTDGPWLADVMDELFACGEPARALELLAKL